MSCLFRVVLPAALLALHFTQVVHATSPEPTQLNTPQLSWFTNYADAMSVSRVQGKMMLIYFFEQGENAARDSFESKTLADPEVQSGLAQFVRVKLPLDAEIEIEGQSTTLIKHEAFTEMEGHQGIAILDFVDPKTDHYGHVVSTFPFDKGRYYTPVGMKVIVNLPPGTLTQRTMIYAVRTHPEHPASTLGQFSPILKEEAEAHSKYQASIRVQGHQDWETRFHRINRRLGNGASASEVVEESWPNQGLVEACIECVHSWRQSPGHWSAVRGRHRLFGYDIKRGANRIWYATGIFSNSR